MKRWFPWITGAIIAGGLIWSFFYLKDLHPLGSLGSKLDDDSLPEVAIRFKDATLVGRSGGEKVWTFDAQTIDVSTNRRFATFQGVARGSLFEDGRQIASLTAEKVVYNTATRDITVPGTVELKFENGPTFRAQDISWNARQSRLFCEEGVDAILDGGTMHGERMTADLEKKVLTIEKVNGRIRLEE